MPSDSSWRPAPVRFDPPSGDHVDRHDVVDAPDRGAVSFAREKFIWLDQVRADPELTPLAFMLAYVIANLVNEREGFAWPSVARLASECHVTKRGVQKVIARLVERGHLSVEHGNGRGETNRFSWIVRNQESVKGIEESRKERRQPPYDGKARPTSPQLHRKGRTPVHPIEAERVNRSSEKGEPPFQKGRTPVHPTLSKESIYDLSYQLSSQRNAQISLSAFDAFWRAYPKKVAPADAMRAYIRAIERAPPNEIIQGAMRYAAEREGEDQRYTKNPATWLNKNCWTDQRPTSRVSPRDGPVEHRHFDRSIVAQLHDDDDFDEALMRIQQQRNKRG